MIYLLNSIIAFRQKPDPLLAQLAPLVGIRILENNNYQMKQKIYESHRSFLLNYYKDYFDQMVLCQKKPFANTGFVGSLFSISFVKHILY